MLVSLKNPVLARKERKEGKEKGKKSGIYPPWCESESVPGLRLSKVQVVDAVQIHVFSVPCESALPHPKIEVRRVDSFDFDPALVLHRVQNGVEMADVPFSHILKLSRARVTKTGVKKNSMC